MNKKVLWLTRTKKCEKEVVFVVIARATREIHEIFANRDDAENKYNTQDYDIQLWSIS